MSEILDAQSTPIGQENWRVCERMLMHDLLDLAYCIPELRALLDFYDCHYTVDGGYTLALPRLKLLERRSLQVIRATQTLAVVVPKKKKKK